jgi:hypothetical protein
MKELWYGKPLLSTLIDVHVGLHGICQHGQKHRPKSMVKSLLKMHFRYKLYTCAGIEEEGRHLGVL